MRKSIEATMKTRTMWMALTAERRPGRRDRAGITVNPA
jgi:hypothetical protein